jgi:hypothetical protein
VSHKCPGRPLSDICRAANCSLFDYLIGEREQRRGNLEAERLGGLEVDNEFELCRLQDRQIGGFRSLENPADTTPRACWRGRKNYPAAEDGFAPSALSCELKTCTPATRPAWGFWPFFGAICGSRFFYSFRGKAYG